MGDFQPSMPPEWAPLGGVVEVVEEGSVGHILVDEKGFVVELDATTQEAYETSVVELTEDSNLIEDLLDGSGVAELGALDGGETAVGKGAHEHLAKAAGAQEVVFGEVVGGFCDFFDGENLGRPAAVVVGVQYITCFAYAYKLGCSPPPVAINHCSY